MLSEFQTRKADYRFDMLDTNGNGVLEAVDYQLAAQRIAAAFGKPELTAELEAGHREIWTALLAASDTDGDGQVSRAEYRAALAGALDDPKGFVAATDAMADLVVSLCGSQLTAADHDKLVTALGETPAASPTSTPAARAI